MDRQETAYGGPRDSNCTPGEMFMYIRLFGSLEIEDGQRWVGPDDLGGRKPKQVLEIVLNGRGRVVSKDGTFDLLCPEGSSQNAAATLSTYVSAPRRHLE